MIYANHIFIISSPILAVVIPCTLTHLFHPARYNWCEINCQRSPWSIASNFKGCLGISSFFCWIRSNVGQCMISIPSIIIDTYFMKCSAVLMSFNPCGDNVNWACSESDQWDGETLFKTPELHFKRLVDFVLFCFN